MHALVRLLYGGALRIQDAIGLKFKVVTLAEPNAAGTRTLWVVPKKAGGRYAYLEEEVYDAVEAYRRAIGADHGDVMFPPGKG